MKTIPTGFIELYITEEAPIFVRACNIVSVSPIFKMYTTDETGCVVHLSTGNSITLRMLSAEVLELIAQSDTCKSLSRE